MEKSDKSPVKANSSVPDIVFHQLKMNKEEKVVAFIENDSEEQLGKLARKGGEILLPGVYPQKNKATEDISKVADGQLKKGKVKVRVDVPTSDTELETLLFYGRSSSSDFKFLMKEEAGRMKKLGNSDNEMTVELFDDEKEAAQKKKEGAEEKNAPAEMTEGADLRTFLAKKSCAGGFSNNSHISRSEDCDCCRPLDGTEDAQVHADPSEAVLQTQQPAEEKEPTTEGSVIEAKTPPHSGEN